MRISLLIFYNNAHALTLLSPIASQPMIRCARCDASRKHRSRNCDGLAGWHHVELTLGRWSITLLAHPKTQTHTDRYIMPCSRGNVSTSRTNVSTTRLRLVYPFRFDKRRARKIMTVRVNEHTRTPCSSSKSHIIYMTCVCVCVVCAKRSSPDYITPIQITQTQTRIRTTFSTVQQRTRSSEPNDFGFVL